uniref:NADH dehydrogenase [ubiquinone] 1 alpha subcomplex assembly factor 4 n=1 Tax=Gouania willdenowi TaxID=441366 RepID=A0A8C5DET0_GOUWI
RRHGVLFTAEIVSQKNEPLLGHLRSVYVQSVEPLPPPSDANAQAVEEEAERRPLRFTFPSPIYGLEDFSDVPKGKLSLAEALKALGSHQHRPKHWTPEKISQEFSLDLKDTKALVEFFIPFKVEIIPPKTRADKQIKASSD